MKTKLEKAIGIAKPDSLRLAIPVTECIHNGSAIGRDTWEIDEDHVLIQERKNRPSQTFERDGISFTIHLQKPIQNKHETRELVPHFIIPMPSKILGIEQYDEGWTINNFEKGTRWMEQTTGIKFKSKAWGEARYSDLDNTIDKLLSDKQWSEEIAELWQRIKPETRAEYGRLFKQKNGLISGFTLNTRDKEANRAVNYKYPHAKGYSKALEIEEARSKGNTWGMEYHPGDRKRYESQIRNGYWNKSQILKTIPRPASFEQLLTVYRDDNQIMTEYANTVLHEGYITLQPQPKVRDMSKERPTAFVIAELMQIIADEANIPADLRMTPEQIRNVIKIRAIQAFGHKTGKATEIAKIVDERWSVIAPKNNPSQLPLDGLKNLG